MQASADNKKKKQKQNTSSESTTWASDENPLLKERKNEKVRLKVKR